MKNRSHRCDINRHGHKYSKYKMWLSMMKLICIKQHLSNILSSIQEKVKQHWGWVKKSVAVQEMFIKIGFKDNHGEKAPSNKTQALTKGTNISIWVVGASNQFSIRGS